MVVVLPSPAGVGLMPVTSTSAPSGWSPDAVDEVEADLRLVAAVRLQRVVRNAQPRRDLGDRPQSCVARAISRSVLHLTLLSLRLMPMFVAGPRSIGARRRGHVVRRDRADAADAEARRRRVVEIADQARRAPSAHRRSACRSQAGSAGACTLTMIGPWCVARQIRRQAQRPARRRTARACWRCSAPAAPAGRPRRRRNPARRSAR